MDTDWVPPTVEKAKEYKSTVVYRLLTFSYFCFLVIFFLNIRMCDVVQRRYCSIVFIENGEHSTQNYTD